MVEISEKLLKGLFLHVLYDMNKGSVDDKLIL